ncbi:MAG: HAMP domain-containing protein [Deltaproteobacteria bacterium]|nr:HAMP domain-containing protein [Deltaproteobacteria bacterium]
MSIRFSIKTKIFCGIVIPASLLVFVIYLDYVHLGSLGRSAKLILSKNYRSIQAAHQIRQHLEARQGLVLDTLLLDKKTGLRDLALDEKISGLLKICKDNITESGEEHIIDDLLSKYAQYDLLFETLFNAENEKIGRKELYPDLIASNTALYADLNALILINEKAMKDAEAETKKIAKQALHYSMTLLITAIVFTAILSYILSTKISRPLIRLAQGLAGVKEGRGDYPQLSITTQDEIGFLTSEFNRLFQRLKAAEKSKARQAEQAKARFIADLSHQLKTPMTSLSMSVGILSDKAPALFGGKYGQLIETAKEDLARLSALINELVDISRLGRMAKPKTKEVLNIEEVVNGCLKPLLYQAKEKGINLEMEFEPGLPPIAIDSFRFPWVVTNLVGNAIRYTDREGRVALRVEKRGSRCYFQCSDTGVGIEEKYLPKIFDRFTQFSEREEMGTIGLGLAIVKEIIEQHGGDISVTSKVGRGTTFTFWIPTETEDVNEESASR